VVHSAAGRLFAVAEGSVEEDDLIRGHRAWTLDLDSIIMHAYDGRTVYHKF
jgi:hypothetical protein